MGKAVDITGKRFGRLIALEPTDQRISGSIVWRCQCDCGNEHFASVSGLRAGTQLSCGCLLEKSHEKGLAKAHKYINEVDRISKTRKSMLIARKSKANTSGYKGVSRRANGKYEAYLHFKGKKISFGIFDTVEEAAQARKDGEEVYFKPILEDDDE